MGESETHRIGGVFVMIGAAPDTEWLGGCLDRDHRGFVRTGESGRATYQTSRPGIYAVGDVRSGSVRRGHPEGGGDAVDAPLP